MKNTNDSKQGIHRRDFIKGSVVASLGLATGGFGILQGCGQGTPPPTGGSAKSNAIQLENARPGTRDWMLTKTRQVPGKINKILNNGRCTWIEGHGEHESCFRFQTGDFSYRLLQRRRSPVDEEY